MTISTPLLTASPAISNSELSRFLVEAAEAVEAFFAGAFLAEVFFVALPAGLPRLVVEPAFFGVVDFFFGVVAFFTPAADFFVVPFVEVRFLAVLALAGDLVVVVVFGGALVRNAILCSDFLAAAMVMQVDKVGMDF